MASKQEYEAAARKHPNDRTSQEEALVKKGKDLNVGDVRRLDAEAERDQRFNW